MTPYDLKMHGDPRLALLPPGKLTACMGLWYLAAGWVLEWETGGFVPIRQVDLLGGTQAEARLLVDAGLWTVAPVELGAPPRGYLFASPSRPTVELDPRGHAKPSRDAANARASRYRARKRDASCVTVTRDGDAEGVTVTREAERDGDVVRHVGGVRGGSEISVSSLSSPPVSPSPLGSESTQLSGCNTPAREEPPQPGRLRWELEELVRAEFAARDVTSQKASAGQWLDGCRTVQEALGLGLYPDARAAMRAFATQLVDAVAAKRPAALGLALQQVQLGAQLRPVVAGGRQLSQLAQDTLRRRAEGL